MIHICWGLIFWVIARDAEPALILALFLTTLARMSPRECYLTSPCVELRDIRQRRVMATFEYAYRLFLYLQHHAMASNQAKVNLYSGVNPSYYLMTEFGG